MNARTLCILTTAATLGVVSAPALAKPGTDKCHRNTPRVKILERFDANGDGKLNEQERTAARESRRAKILEHFDTNGDGLIDDSEKEAIKKTRKERRGKRRQRILKQFDANGDGVLDNDEKKTARKARRHRNRKSCQDRQPRATPVGPKHRGRPGGTGDAAGMPAVSPVFRL